MTTDPDDVSQTHPSTVDLTVARLTAQVRGDLEHSGYPWHRSGVLGDESAETLTGVFPLHRGAPESTNSPARPARTAHASTSIGVAVELERDRRR